MKSLTITLLALGGCALALAGCGKQDAPSPPPPLAASPKPISQLKCPEKQGRLHRLTQAKDGQGCEYSDNHGQDVSLRLMAIGNPGADTVLSGIENGLFALMPAANMPPAPPATPKPPEPPKAKDASQVALPGMKVTTSHGSTVVQIGGLSIHTQDKDGSVSINAAGTSGTMPRLHSDQGTVNVNANGDTAVIRMHDQGEGIRRSLIIASETPGPTGYRLVGYEARGPVSGPLVVATIKGKGKKERQVFKDMKALVSLNSGR